jgi:hypothetical protein
MCRFFIYLSKGKVILYIYVFLGFIKVRPK